MSCISSNFSSFFLDSLNDPSEFAKYLSNGENKFSTFEDFQVFGTAGNSYGNSQQQQQNYGGSSGGGYYNNGMLTSNINSNAAIGGSGVVGAVAPAVTSAGGQNHNNSGVFNSSAEGNNFNQHALTTSQPQQYVGHPTSSSFQHNNHQHPLPPHTHSHAHPHAHLHQQTHNQATSNPAQGFASPLQRWSSASTHHSPGAPAANLPASSAGAQHFDGSFEFLKYLRHSNDYSSSGAAGASSSSNSADDVATTATSTANQTTASLIDLDTSTSMKPRSARKAAALLSSATRAVSALDTTLDVFDHDDSKHTIFDLQHHITNSSNSNEESSMDVSNLAFPHSLLNASNSNTSSEGAAAGNADFSNLNAAASNAPKPLANVIIKENFDVHPSHKVEEGIFQHMNKLPPKKKENLKQLGVRFTGQMTLADKSIVVENFIKFCQEYEITDHRPYLSLNQSGLNKPEQIKFARYLGQGLPSFTLFCIYSNFKNLFCTKRTEIYTKDGYNLPYILDKTKRFLSNTTAGGTTTTPNKQIHCAPPTPLHTPMTMGPTI